MKEFQDAIRAAGLVPPVIVYDWNDAINTGVWL